MAEKSTATPPEPFQIPKELLAAQQKLLTSSLMPLQVTEALRSIAQANANYIQELMRANTALLAAFMERATDEAEEAPSELVRRRRASGP